MKPSPASSSSPSDPASSTACQNRSRFQIATPANSESMDEEGNMSSSSRSQSFDQDKDYLRPPALKRQFLLSPPPSPPVGWEPPTEAQPMINYELLAALSKMVPGQPLELHPPEQDKPAIVVHICEDPDTSDPSSLLFPAAAPSIRIPQTARPPVKSNQSNQSATA